jgi:hypothetical protein
VSRVPSGHGEAPRHQSLVYCAVELTGARRPEIPFRSKEDRQGRVGGQSHRWVVAGSVRLPEPPLCSSGGGPRGRMMVALSGALWGGQWWQRRERLDWGPIHCRKRLHRRHLHATAPHSEPQP